MEEAGEIESVYHTCYYHRVPIIRKVLLGQGQEVDLRHTRYFCLDLVAEDTLENKHADRVMLSFLMMLDFINELDVFNYLDFNDIFRAFFDVSPDMANFTVSDAFLAQIEELSPRDCQQIRKKLLEYGGKYDRFRNSLEFHNQILGILEDNVSLGSMMQALVSATNAFTMQFLKALDNYDEDKCRMIGESFKSMGDAREYGNYLQDYYQWLGERNPVDMEFQLARRLGYYVDILYQTDFLKPYRDSVKVIYNKAKDVFFFEKYPYRYNNAGLLEPLTLYRCPHDLFFWKKHELVEVSILRKIFPDFCLDSIALGKLILDNRLNFSDYKIKSLVTCLELYPKLKFMLQGIIKNNTEKNHHYTQYMTIDNVVIPDEMKSDKAVRIWNEFVEEGYMVKEDGHYFWIHTNIREFGYFVYYAHQFFYKKHAKDEIINWDAYCSFFSQSILKKRSYGSGRYEVSKIEESATGKKKIPESAKRIKKIFRRFR